MNGLNLYAYLAITASGGLGYFGYKLVFGALNLKRYKRAVLAQNGFQSSRSSQDSTSNNKSWDILISFLRRETLRYRQAHVHLALTHADDRSRHSKEMPLWLQTALQTAGLKDLISYEGLNRLRCKLSVLFGLGGFLLGFCFSGELAFLLGLVAAVLGFRMPRRVLKELSLGRKRELETQLPEMLDIVALGLSSGLSFDRSLQTYCVHFESSLSQDIRSYLNQWGRGLVSRDEALKELAASYDSRSLSRIVDNIIRSLQFGSSLAESLSCSARDAREARQMSQQEIIAKIPVKIMVPTCTLILPAMLLLVLGPIMLDLGEGFS